MANRQKYTLPRHPSQPEAPTTYFEMARKNEDKEAERLRARSAPSTITPPHANLAEAWSVPQAPEPPIGYDGPGLHLPTFGMDMTTVDGAPRARPQPRHPLHEVIADLAVLRMNVAGLGIARLDQILGQAQADVEALIEATK